MRIEQDWFFHYLTKHDEAIDGFDRKVYARAYSSRTAIRAGDAWYQTFPEDIAASKTYQPLKMPLLSLGGPGYGWLKAAMLINRAENASVVKFKDSGHFIPDEQPKVLVKHLRDFLDSGEKCLSRCWRMVLTGEKRGRCAIGYSLIATRCARSLGHT